MFSTLVPCVLSSHSLAEVRILLQDKRFCWTPLRVVHYSGISWAWAGAVGTCQAQPMLVHARTVLPNPKSNGCTCGNVLPPESPLCKGWYCDLLGKHKGHFSKVREPPPGHPTPTHPVLGARTERMVSCSSGTWLGASSAGADGLMDTRLLPAHVPQSSQSSG